MMPKKNIAAINNSTSATIPNTDPPLRIGNVGGAVENGGGPDCGR